MKRIKIDIENWDLTEALPDNSQLVVVKVELLDAVIPVDSLAQDITIIAQCIQLAYNGVASFPKLQIRVLHSGQKSISLCYDMAITLNAFVGSSQKVLSRLAACFEYLLDAQEEDACDVLARLEQVAGEMMKKATSLSEQFKTESEVMKEILSDTISERGNQYEIKEQSTKQIAISEIDQKTSQDAIREVEKQMSNAQRLFNDIQKKLNTKEKDYENAFKKLNTLEDNVCTVSAAYLRRNPNIKLESSDSYQ